MHDSREQGKRGLKLEKPNQRNRRTNRYADFYASNVGNRPRSRNRMHFLLHYAFGNKGFAKVLQYLLRSDLGSLQASEQLCLTSSNNNRK